MKDDRQISGGGRVKCGAFALRIATFLLALTAGIGGETQVFAQVVHAKDGEVLPSFEVARVKPNVSGGHHEHVWVNDNSFRIENLTLRQIISRAYGVQSDAQLSTGSDAVLDARFDLNAKVDDTDFARIKTLPREDQTRAIDLMLQSLLAERFHLKVHFDTKELPVFALVVDKGGPKFEASVETRPAADSAKAPSSAPPGPVHNGGFTVNSNSVKADLTANDREIYWLTGALSRQPEMDGRIVVDKTGLTGRYEYSLHWAPQRLTASNGTTAAADVPDGPSLFTALREQLGLRLESQKAGVEIVVVDHVEAPLPN